MKELEAACAAEGIALTANMRLELARVAIYFGHFDVSFSEFGVFKRGFAVVMRHRFRF